MSARTRAPVARRFAFIALDPSNSTILSVFSMSVEQESVTIAHLQVMQPLLLRLRAFLATLCGFSASIMFGNHASIEDVKGRFNASLSSPS